MSDSEIEFHKARYLDASKPHAERIESARWLIDHGFIGIEGRMIVTTGELPK